VNAGNIEKDAPDVFGQPRGYGISAKPRAITTDNSVLGDRTIFAAQIGKYDYRHSGNPHFEGAKNTAPNFKTADQGIAPESI